MGEERLTHSYLVERAAKWLVSRKRCKLVMAEAYTHTEKPDAFGVVGYRGQTHLVECKVSIQDFYADRRKPWRVVSEMGMGDFRWFLTPPGLLREVRLPECWGLLECGRVIRVVTEAQRQPRANKYWELGLVTAHYLNHAGGRHCAAAVAEQK